ncbi:MAG: hypothetical protein CBC29_06440 [Methylococcaceae bacterium TMED69]|nr:MAG: hypothetical protein CBC29_06440 [Methylococcaceae bacterium TMED69]|tara:strand:- start:2560 stop:3342 length:783 start_codon:yes stop_codon:yes gene_type:complete
MTKDQEIVEWALSGGYPSRSLKEWERRAIKNAHGRMVRAAVEMENLSMSPTTTSKMAAVRSENAKQHREKAATLEKVMKRFNIKEERTMKITERQLRKIIRESLNEADCWDGYAPGAKSGKKTKISSKTGKKVNNCEKIGEIDEIESDENKEKYMDESVLRETIRDIVEACYDGRKVKLNKKMSNPENPKKKSKVYVTGKGKYKSGACKGQNKAKKVQFGDPNMKIKKSNPKNRKSFRARHNCDNPGPKDKARYWSCKSW